MLFTRSQNCHPFKRLQGPQLSADLPHRQDLPRRLPCQDLFPHPILFRMTFAWQPQRNSRQECLVATSEKTGASAQWAVDKKVLDKHKASVKNHEISIKNHNK